MRSSVIIKRSVIVNGHKTSISLEDAFWSEVKAIASEKHTTISELLTNIDRDRQGANLSSALRVFVLKHHQSTLGRAIVRMDG
jgi:predicted DNA-binding ribbon-helix-helix protein